MKYSVLLTVSAEDDLLGIYKYVYINDSPGSAERLYKKIVNLLYKLEEFPERGHTLPELENIRNYNFLEVHFKPYRIIYHIKGNIVYINGIFDGRRQMQKLLEDRLFKS